MYICSKMLYDTTLNGWKRQYSRYLPCWLWGISNVNKKVMQVTLELYEFKRLIVEMSEIGAANYVKLVSPNSDVLSERKAYIKFGESNVKRWVKEGSVKFKRMGVGKNSKKIYSYAQLLSVIKAEKLLRGRGEE